VAEVARVGPSRAKENEYLPSRLIWSKTRGPEAGEIFWLNGETFSSKLLLGCVDILGRPQKLNVEQINLVRLLINEGKPVREIADTFNVHTAIIYRLSTAA
jgi:hypothetical protein